MTKTAKAAVRKGPDPIDICVGSRIRLKRTMLGMSQTKLGDSLGVTFQQVQKYEKGVNRVGASRLQHVANLLNEPVGYFFEDYNQSHNQGGFSEDGEVGAISEFLTSREGIELNRSFAQIRSRNVRRKLIELVKGMANED